MAKQKPSQVLTDAAAKLNQPVEDRASLSLGVPLLNLAVSGDWRKGLLAGTFTFYAGTSASGKTIATLYQLAEAANNPAFDEYELWHINAEVGAFFPYAQFFGQKAASRIQTMEPTDGNPIMLETVYDFIEAKINAGKKLVLIIDSMDALSSEHLEAHSKACSKARAEGKDTPGSYGDKKASVNSEQLKRLVAKINTSGSIITAICQLRDNINGGMFEPKFTRGGGHAVKYYASVEIWTSPGAKITKTCQGKERTIGINARFAVKKNRITGRERIVTIPILPSVGMDAIGAAVDYLVEEKTWTVSGGRIVNTLYDKSYYREELIRKIEDDNREEELYDTMQACWDNIESQLNVTRKQRFE